MTIFPSAYDFDECIPVWKTWWFRLFVGIVCAVLLVTYWIGWL